MAPMDNATRDRLIEEQLRTASGRQRLASSMQQPLRSQRDYLSVARKAYYVEQLPDGALPIYDKDPDVTAYVIGEEGEGISAVVKSRRVIFPLFEIASVPETPLTQVKERRFDVLKRMQDKARSAVMQAEDVRSFAIMDAVALAGFDSVGPINPTLPVAAPLNSDVLADAFAGVEQHDLAVSWVFINPVDYTDFRKFGRDIYDPETQRSVLNSGVMGTLWGAKLVTSRLVPRGTIYVTCDPEMFGRMPVRTELTVLSADDPKARTIGFSIFENLGIGCFNPRGLQVLEVTR